MSLLPSPLAAALAGTGLACFAIGATRRPDPGLKLTGLAVLVFALAPVPASFATTNPDRQETTSSAVSVLAALALAMAIGP